MQSYIYTAAFHSSLIKKEIVKSLNFSQLLKRILNNITTQNYNMLQYVSKSFFILFNFIK